MNRTQKEDTTMMIARYSWKILEGRKGDGFASSHPTPADPEIGPSGKFPWFGANDDSWNYLLLHHVVQYSASTVAAYVQYRTSFMRLTCGMRASVMQQKG